MMNQLKERSFKSSKTCSLGGSVCYLYWPEYRFRCTGSSSFAILRIYNSSKERTGASPCPFLIDEDKRVMSLRFDLGLQIDSPVAHHLGDFRIAVR